MHARHIIRRARRRAGLTQADLAARLSTTQSAVARWEAGQVSPSFDAVVRAVEACGLELRHQVSQPEPAEWSLAQQNLRLTPSQRLDQLVRTVGFAQAGREALAARPGDV